MALSKEKALESARYILNGPRAAESTRLDRIFEALKPCGVGYVPNVEIPEDSAPALKRLARKASTNFLPLLVKTFSQVMKVDGYYSPGSADLAPPWTYWQRNNMDARQTGVHRAALQYGASYVTVLPGDTGPVMRGVSPRNMTALYQNPADDEWPMLALHVDGQQMYLYDETTRYTFGLEQYPRPALAPSYSVSMQGAYVGYLTYIESQEHGMGFCPVVRFRDRMLLDGEEQYGIVEPLMTIQERIDETTFGMLVAQYFAAFKQRYIIGWVPESEQEFLSATASDVWTFSGDDGAKVEVGQLDETDLTRYIASKASAIRDFSAIGQIPAQNLGVDGISNISDATLAGLETGKDREADEITTSLGESWEQALRTCALIAGDTAAAADFEGEVKWKDSTARSFAQTVDGLGKLAQMLGIPRELLWEDVPGWTQQKVERAKELAQQGDALGNLTQLLADQSASA